LTNVTPNQPRNFLNKITQKNMSQAKIAYTSPRLWHVVDAKDQVLGRLATQVTRLLVGKHKPTCTPHVDGGDHVVVLNARNVAMTGKKPTEKLYRWHTGWMGGLKTLTARQVMERDPARIIEHAIKGMLPKNNTRDVRMKRLRVFADDSGITKHAVQIEASKTYASKHLELNRPRDVRPLFILESRQKGAILGDAERVFSKEQLDALEKSAKELKHDPSLQAEYEQWLKSKQGREKEYEEIVSQHVAARARELEEDEKRTIATRLNGNGTINTTKKKLS
jgi:large subunit ribosomal protein L13